MGTPDYVTPGARKFAYEFRDTGRTIDPSWKEWAWFDESEFENHVRSTYVGYVSGDVVERFGVIRNSPPPPRGNCD